MTAVNASAEACVPKPAADIFAMLDPGRGVAISENLAAEILEEMYGLAGSLRLLTGERDQNFHLAQSGCDGFIFKVWGQSQRSEEVELLTAVLAFLERNAPRLRVPRLLLGRDGRDLVTFKDHVGNERRGVVYSFLPGQPLSAVERTVSQHHQCGRMLAELAIALRGFSHSAMHRALIWDLRHLPRLRMLVSQNSDLPFREFVRPFLDAFERNVAGRLAQVPQQFVHNDFNARNIIVDDASHVTGVIDFGDAVCTARVIDVAVGVIGQLSTPETSDLAIGEFVEAYAAVSPLSSEERALLPSLVAGRIVQNVVMTSWYRSRQPSDGHFAAFGPEYFEWRVDLAARLASGMLT